MKVKEEGGPCGRLMFRHRGDDGDVDLGVSSVPQGVKTTAPRGHETYESKLGVIKGEVIKER